MQNILEKELKNNYLERFPKLRELAIRKKIPIIMPETVMFIEKIVEKYQPKTILEIGTAIGYSSLIMANKLDGKIRIDTVDASKPSVLEAQKNIEKYKYSDVIFVYHNTGINFLKSIKNEYDLIFIDAKKEEYPEYFKLSKLRLKQKGIILLDNLLWKGKVRQNNMIVDNRVKILRKFNNELLNDKSGTTKIYEIGDGVGVYINNPN